MNAFVERAGSAVCLVCNDTIASMKWLNVKCHFDMHQAEFELTYSAGHGVGKKHTKSYS